MKTKTGVGRGCCITDPCTYFRTEQSQWDSYADEDDVGPLVKFTITAGSFSFDWTTGFEYIQSMASGSIAIHNTAIPGDATSAKITAVMDMENILDVGKLFFLSQGGTKWRIDLQPGDTDDPGIVKVFNTVGTQIGDSIEVPGFNVLVKVRVSVCLYNGALTVNVNLDDNPGGFQYGVESTYTTGHLPGSKAGIGTGAVTQSVRFYHVSALKMNVENGSCPNECIPPPDVPTPCCCDNELSVNAFLTITRISGPSDTCLECLHGAAIPIDLIESGGGPVQPGPCTAPAGITYVHHSGPFPGTNLKPNFVCEFDVLDLYCTGDTMFCRFWYTHPSGTISLAAVWLTLDIISCDPFNAVGQVNLRNKLLAGEMSCQMPDVDVIFEFEITE